MAPAPSPIGCCVPLRFVGCVDNITSQTCASVPLRQFTEGATCFNNACVFPSTNAPTASPTAAPTSSPTASPHTSSPTSAPTPAPTPASTASRAHKPVYKYLKRLFRKGRFRKRGGGVRQLLRGGQGSEPENFAMNDHEESKGFDFALDELDPNVRAEN